MARWDIVCVIQLLVTAVKSDDDGVELTSGQVAGIVIGCFVLLKLVAVLVGLCWAKCKRPDAVENEPESSLDRVDPNTVTELPGGHVITAPPYSELIGPPSVDAGQWLAPPPYSNPDAPCDYNLPPSYEEATRKADDLETINTEDVANHTTMSANGTRSNVEVGLAISEDTIM